MKQVQNNARLRAGHGEINRQRLPQRRYDRQRPETASAIREFEVWDRAMQRQHGALYYRAMGYTVH
jgi:hypothetical protein